MSYQAINPSSLVISTTGSGREALADAAVELKNRGFRLVAGFDNDKAGDKMAETLSAAVGHDVERIRPRVGKDWNDQLKADHKKEAQAEREK